MKNFHIYNNKQNTLSSAKQNNTHNNSPNHPINKKPTNNQHVIIAINNFQHDLKLLQSTFVKLTKALYYFKNKLQRTNKILPTFHT